MDARAARRLLPSASSQGGARIGPHPRRHHTSHEYTGGAHRRVLPPAAGRDRLLRESFARAVKRAKQLLPADTMQWTWGQLHTMTFRHPLSSRGPEFAKAFDLAPAAKGGDGVTPHAASHNPQFKQLS